VREGQQHQQRDQQKRARRHRRRPQVHPDAERHQREDLRGNGNQGTHTMFKRDARAALNGEPTTPLVIPASALRQVSEWDA